MVERGTEQGGAAMVERKRGSEGPIEGEIMVEGERERGCRRPVAAAARGRILRKAQQAGRGVHVCV